MTTQADFDLRRQQWSLLNRFHSPHCTRPLWCMQEEMGQTDTDLCPYGEIQMMFATVDSCPLTKLNGALSQLHSADNDAVTQLTTFGNPQSTC